MYSSNSNNFDPIKFLDVAKTIKGSSYNGEEYCRTLINRAYYAAFGHIRKKIPSVVNRGPSVHKDLIDYLKNINGYKIIGDNLEELFKKRKRSDYDYYTKSQNISDCSFIIQDAEQIINDFDKLENERKNNIY